MTDSGGENEAVLEPGSDEVLIQIMTPDGQIVTTTSKQSDLVQSLQLEQGGGQEVIGEQTYVLQSATTGGEEQIHQFQVRTLNCHFDSTSLFLNDH